MTNLEIYLRVKKYGFQLFAFSLEEDVTTGEIVSDDIVVTLSLGLFSCSFSGVVGGLRSPHPMAKRLPVKKTLTPKPA